jgi:DNA-binding NarL/FixJ family response regulator
MSSEITPCENEVVVLLLQGCSNPEIAAQLGIHEQKVKERLGVLYRAAGISDGRKRVRLIESLSTSIERLPLPALTPRERQITKLVLAGRTNPQISVELGINVQQIKNYLLVVFDKCGVWSRTELAARFRCA